MRIINRRFLIGFFGVLVVLAAALALSSCGDSDIPGHNSLLRHVKNNPVGRDSDQWIEKYNMAGEWERTGLIFGYVDDQGECLKAIAGLKQANPAAEYRCIAANVR